MSHKRKKKGTKKGANAPSMCPDPGSNRDGG